MEALSRETLHILFTSPPCASQAAGCEFDFTFWLRNFVGICPRNTDVKRPSLQFRNTGPREKPKVTRLGGGGDGILVQVGLAPGPQEAGTVNL